MTAAGTTIPIGGAAAAANQAVVPPHAETPAEPATTRVIGGTAETEQLTDGAAESLIASEPSAPTGAPALPLDGRAAAGRGARSPPRHAARSPAAAPRAIAAGPRR